MKDFWENTWLEGGHGGGGGKNQLSPKEYKEGL